jgi:hypothetical protein
VNKGFNDWAGTQLEGINAALTAAHLEPVVLPPANKQM